MIIPVSQSTVNTTAYYWGQGGGGPRHASGLSFFQRETLTCGSRTDFPSLLSTMKGKGRASPRWKLLPLCLTFLLLAVEPEDP